MGTKVGKKSVYLVQQGVWDMPKESMPLACGYLKATALGNDNIREEMEIEIFNFSGGDSLSSMAQRMFCHGIPDILACSVLGWNYHSLGSLASTFHQCNPGGWVILGGNHVANQGKRVFRMFPDVDIIVNGEGEFVFRDLLLAYLHGLSPQELSEIRGISYCSEYGEVVTSAPVEPILDLDRIPSPFLSNAIEMVDANGEFRYDVALMESNRGCPYRCSFCYWGGAVGQKVRSFSRTRLQEELDFFGFHRVPALVLCDANFGMLRQDAEFIEDLIRTREKYGFPKALETSWAKNKTNLFYEIVDRMKEANLQSSFTLALQTLDDGTLQQMSRKNMKINDWEDLIEWLSDRGFDCYAELIWGAPGETYDSFLSGYDKLAERIPRIATYPLLVLPNTTYHDHREDYGLITVRGDRDDFEYVLAHRTMTIEDNQRMHRFLFWSRLVAENRLFRYIWTPLRKYAGMSQSEILQSMDDWFEQSEDPTACLFKASREPIVDAGVVSSTLHHFYEHPGSAKLFQSWWQERIQPFVPRDYSDFLADVFRYDQIIRPIFVDDESNGSRFEVVERGGTRYYVRRNVHFKFSVPELVAAMNGDRAVEIQPQRHVTTLYYRVGFRDYLDSHELASAYFGIPEAEVHENGGLLESRHP